MVSNHIADWCCIFSFSNFMFGYRIELRSCNQVYGISRIAKLFDWWKCNLIFYADGEIFGGTICITIHEKVIQEENTWMEILSKKHLGNEMTHSSRSHACFDITISSFRMMLLVKLSILLDAKESLIFAHSFWKRFKTAISIYNVMVSWNCSPIMHWPVCKVKHESSFGSSWEKKYHGLSTHMRTNWKGLKDHFFKIFWLGIGKVSHVHLLDLIFLSKKVGSFSVSSKLFWKH